MGKILAVLKYNILFGTCLKSAEGHLVDSKENSALLVFQVFGGEENEQVHLFHYCRRSIVD